MPALPAAHRAQGRWTRVGCPVRTAAKRFRSGAHCSPAPIPAPAHPLLAPREGEPAPQGARRAVPVREDAAAPGAAQFRGLRGYLATRRPAARLLHSHQHAGGDRAVSAQSRRMGRGARPPYPFRDSRHLLGFFHGVRVLQARHARSRPAS